MSPLACTTSLSRAPMMAQTDAHQRCSCRRSAFMTFLPQLNTLATGDCVGMCCLARPPILNRGGNRKIAPFRPATWLWS